MTELKEIHVNILLIQKIPEKLMKLIDIIINYNNQSDIVIDYIKYKGIKTVIPCQIIEVSLLVDIIKFSKNEVILSDNNSATFIRKFGAL